VLVWGAKRFGHGTPGLGSARLRRSIGAFSSRRIEVNDKLSLKSNMPTAAAGRCRGVSVFTLFSVITTIAAFQS